MNQRQIILIVMIVSIPITVIVIALAIVSRYYPTLIGLPPNPEDTLTVDTFKEENSAQNIDSSLIDPKIEIPRSILDDWQFKLMLYEVTKAERDTFEMQNRILNDTILSLTAQLLAAKDSFNLKSGEFSRLSTISLAKDDTVEQKSRLISALQLQIKSLTEKLNAKQAESELEQQKKLANDALYKEFAQIYGNSEPARVARILEKLPPEDSYRILSQIDKKKAGKIIDVMKAEYSAELLKGYKK